MNKPKPAPAVSPVEPYIAIVASIRPAIEAGADTLQKHFRNCGMGESGEIPHKSGPGFIATTEGGWECSYKLFISELDENFKRSEMASEFHEKIDKHNHYVDERALEIAMGDEDWWENVLDALDKDRTFKTYEPKDIREVQRDLEAAGDETGLSETLEEEYVQSAREESDEYVDFRVQALLFAPDNPRNEVGGGNWEIRLFGEVAFGEVYWLRAKPEQDKVEGLEVQIAVDPKNIDPEFIGKQMEKGVAKITNWMRGLHTPVQSPAEDVDLDSNPHFRVINYQGVGPVCNIPSSTFSPTVTQAELDGLLDLLGQGSHPFWVETDQVRIQGYTGNVRAQWVDGDEEDALITAKGLVVTMKGETPDKPSQIEGMVTNALLTAWDKDGIDIFKFKGYSAPGESVPDYRADPDWTDDDIQFPRVLAAIRDAGGFTDAQKLELGESMDLEWESLDLILASAAIDNDRRLGTADEDTTLGSYVKGNLDLEELLDEVNEEWLMDQYPRLVAEVRAVVEFNPAQQASIYKTLGVDMNGFEELLERGDLVFEIEKGNLLEGTTLAQFRGEEA